MQFDQDTIKELAVHAVQRFVSDKTPLDESIAERAKAFHLNEEQVRRVVEATNTIAFLKLRESAEDKTFEFKVASFQGVMDCLVGAPSSAPYVSMDDISMDKEAGELEKVASESPLEISDDLKHVLLNRHYHHVRAEIEKVAMDLYSCTDALERNVPVLVKQANWQERLSVVSTETEYAQIMSAFGNSGFEKKASLEDLVFVGKELEIAKTTVSLIKQAGQLKTRQAELETMEKRAYAALATLVGRGLRGVRGTAKVGGVMSGKNGVASGARGVGGSSVGQDASKATKDMWKSTKKAVKSPVATASNVTGGLAAATTAPIGAAIGATIKGTSWASRNLKKTSLGAAGLTGMALSSATYQPKINQRTGRPNDVWANIYD